VRLGCAGWVYRSERFRVRNLTLERVLLGHTSSPSQEIVSFLALFSHVEYLQILHPILSHQHPDQMHLGVPLPPAIASVKALKIYMGEITQFLVSYLQILRMQELIEVDLLPSHEQDLTQIGTFLHHAAPTLQRIRLSVHGIAEQGLDPELWRTLNLSHCPALEKLVFGVFTKNTIYPGIPRMFGNVLDILERQKPSSIIELILEGGIGTNNKDIINFLPDFNWASLDNHLCDNYSLLKTVHFCFSEVQNDTTYTSDEVRRPIMMDEVHYIIDHLPRCRHRGLLRFTLEGRDANPSPTIIVPDPLH